MNPLCSLACADLWHNN